MAAPALPWLTDAARDIAAATGAPFEVVETAEVGGGDINQAYRLSGRDFACFLKFNPADGARAMFEAEAAGLAELARAAEDGGPRVPRPLCSGGNGQGAWLVMEYLQLGRGGEARAMGLALARLHRRHADQFGWHRDNTIGATPQHNGRMADWTAFWQTRRLLPQLELAARKRAPRRMLERGHRLVEDCGLLLAGHAPRPSLLHGDLWGGNAGYDETGAPVIFDPAVYYGDREADLAMTELFGGFDADFQAAYREAWPLADHYPLRRILYNLYHVLNHFNLFGGGYAEQATHMAERLLAELA